MNPMIRKELRQRMRERRAWILPTLYLLVIGGAVALAYYLAAEEFNPFSIREIQGAQLGGAIFYTVIFSQMAVLLLLAPVFSAGSVTIEKEQRTLPSLLTSLLSVGQIWWGKFVAALLFLILLLVSALPLLSLTFAFGGVSAWQVIEATGVTLLTLACMCAVGLYCSTVFRRSVHATAACYGVVITLTVLTFVAYTILETYWRSHQLSRPATAQPPEYILFPLYLNPFFPLGSILFAQDEAVYRHWQVSLLLYAALGCITAGFALRNLRRSGEA